MAKRILRVAVPLVLALTAIGVGLFFFLRHAHRKADDQLTLYGNVDIRQVDLGFRVAGRVAAMKLEEGDRARAGELLAELDARPYQDQVQAAQAEVAQQSALVDKLVRGPRPAEIRESRARLNERKAELANARQSYERVASLRESGANAESTLDDARAARDMAEARVASASEELRLLHEGTRPEDIEAARASLDSARARLATAETALADTRLLAPSNGVVLSRVREPGAIVGPSDVVYQLSLTRPVWIRAYVAEPQLGRIHPGMEVQVTSDSAPKRAQRGRIGFISPVAEFTPKSVETPELRTDLVYRLRVIVDDPDESLRQGMPVTVRVANAAHRTGDRRPLARGE